MHVDTSKCKGGHGEKLSMIYDAIYELANQSDYFVRERGFSRFPATTQILFKVVGTSDLALWDAKRAAFEEITPSEVKKVVAGNGKATKGEVGECLSSYVGVQAYACEDESDAVAVGVAWMQKKFT